MKRLISSIAVFTLCAAGGVVADDPPVALHIDAPNSNGGVVLLSESGWPLNFKMVVNFEDMLGYAIHQNYPNKGRFGFIVFDDPDSCPWMDDEDWRSNFPPPLGCEGFVNEEFEVTAQEDETYLEFRPDVDEAGMPDNSGDAAEQAELVDSAGSGGPEFQIDNADTCVPGTDDDDCFKFGPNTGGEEVDGFGYGNDDDLPGLFLYTKVGTGLVYDEPNFDLDSPMGVRNLAGMINSVTYDLSDLTKTNVKAKGQKGKPTEVITEEARVWAHMNMPQQLIRNIIQYDACTGDSTACDGDNAWRIDGGAIETPPQVFGRGDAASIWQLENTTFEVHAFMVSGHAPDVLYDANGDGHYADDAALAGYTVISNVDSIELIQLSNIQCFGGGGSVMAVDLDSNGESTVPIVCPTGPGDIDRPPR